MAQTILKRFYQPTPKRYRRIGDAILYFCVGIQPMTQTLPVSDTTRLWIGFGLSLLGIVGKTITNFFTDEDFEERGQIEQAETPADK